MEPQTTVTVQEVRNHRLIVTPRTGVPRMNPTLLFTLFTAVAFLLFVFEVFVPGGVLGAMGGVCLLVACGFAFKAFGGVNGSVVSLLLVLGTLCGFMFWLMKMPDSRIGKRFSLQATIYESEPAKDTSFAPGTLGVAETDLRPGGFARIEGKKTDVLASTGYIEKGTELEVVEAQRIPGCRTTVSKGTSMRLGLGLFFLWTGLFLHAQSPSGEFWRLLKSASISRR